MDASEKTWPRIGRRSKHEGLQARLMLHYLRFPITLAPNPGHLLEQMCRRFLQANRLNNIPAVGRTDAVSSIGKWQCPTDIIDGFLAPVLRRLDVEHLPMIAPQFQSKESQIVCGPAHPGNRLPHRIRPGTHPPFSNFGAANRLVNASAHGWRG